VPAAGGPPDPTLLERLYVVQARRDAELAVRRRFAKQLHVLLIALDPFAGIRADRYDARIPGGAPSDLIDVRARERVEGAAQNLLDLG
jgi:hypothetical protein